jgi:multimeric flavodoxin WrbA/putative sterol carrier protein
MNILVINGSPKGENSNTLKLANAFIGGINNNGNNFIETITISQKTIEHCRGCFCCWEKTPGKCIIKDDMETIFEKYINADLVIWSFPLYYYGIPSKTKAFIDRLLPNNMPDIIMNDDGRAKHLTRHDLQHQRHILVSTCGFFTVKNNCEAMVKQFEIMFDNRLTTILCPEGELFRVPQLEERTDEYLSYVTKAGEEYITQGFFSNDIQNKLNEPLFPAEQFMEMANISWERRDTAEETKDGASRLLRQMAAIYKPHGKDTDIILEFYFTDIGKVYQLVLGKTKCEYRDENLKPCTARIETSFEIWSRISEGKLNGKEALFQHKYSVLGDISAMVYLESCFSRKNTKYETKNVPAQKRDMLLLLLPWIAFWAAIPLIPDLGVYIALVVAAAMPLFYGLRKTTVYDAISVFCVTVLSIATIVKIDVRLLMPLSYFFFSLLWLVSLFTRIPLCAWYSSNKWGGDTAFENPLFVLTNKIICAGWGVMYLITSVCAWFLMRSDYAQFTGIITQVCPALMGIFTAVFSKRFPAYYAGKT